MKVTLLRGLRISYDKELGLGVAAPPNITIVFLILILLDPMGPNRSKQHFVCNHAHAHMH